MGFEPPDLRLMANNLTTELCRQVPFARKQSFYSECDKNFYASVSLRVRVNIEKKDFYAFLAWKMVPVNLIWTLYFTHNKNATRLPANVGSLSISYRKPFD